MLIKFRFMSKSITRSPVQFTLPGYCIELQKVEFVFNLEFVYYMPHHDHVNAADVMCCCKQ